MPNPSKINTLIAVAKEQYNQRVKENPANSNNVKYNTWFYGHEVSGIDYPWCMAFVQWCCNQAGISVPRVASCNSFWNSISENQVSAKIPPAYLKQHQDALQPGDIALFIEKNPKSQDDLYSHVGIIIEKLGNSKYKTIEGNTSYDDYGSQSNGGAVALKVRSTNPADGFYINGAVRLINEIGTPTLSQSSITDFINNTKEQVSNAGAGIVSAIQSGINYTFGGALSELQERVKNSQKADQKVEMSTVTSAKNLHEIVSIKEDPNRVRLKGTSLLTTPTYVESPFIILEVGKYTFGSYTAKGSLQATNSQRIVTYPNYMTGIDIVKVNGSVNQYTIQMVYQIQAGQDPNLIDKIFSTVGYGGTVYISYGDWNAPSFRYKREEAIITNLTSSIDFASSRINYTLRCTSNAVKLFGDYHSYPAGKVQPSTAIIDLLYNQNNKYHLLDMFPGMANKDLVLQRGLIKTDDIVVDIEAKISLDILSYLNYLVSCMTDSSSKVTGLRKSNYYLTICDDITGEYGGTYFKITKLTADSYTLGLDTSGIYEVDVGYPGDTLVTNFSINTDNSWSLLYNYSNDLSQEEYTYDIDSKGNIVQSSSPNILRSAIYGRVTEEQRNWWTQMTQFPINATLEIKGLLRPAMLMSYVRINAFFYGQRHVSSGVYAVTKQQDRIDSRGYRTTLSLVRIAGDLDTIHSATKMVSYTVPKVVSGS